MTRIWIRAVATATAVGLVAGAVAIAATGATSGPARPVRMLGPNGDATPGLAEGEGGAKAKPVAGKVAMPHRTESLASLPSTPPTAVPWVKKELLLEGEDEGDGEQARPALGSTTALHQVDEALQTERGAGGQIPAPDVNVAGLGSAANPYNLVPSDSNGDVGGGYYLQMVNIVLAIYDADTGAKIEGPHFLSELFDLGTQKLCATHDDGDPIVVYDEYADVWVISQFALNLNRPKFAQCIAVSDTSDPTGAWFAYQFDYPNPNVLNDYPKFGVWPSTNNSAYFASFNQFRCSPSVCDFAWRGAGAIAYERDAMIAGDPADPPGQIYVNLYPVRKDIGGILPSDADGANAPGASAPNVYMMFDADEWDYPDDQLELFEFSVDWGTDTPTFSGPTIVATAPVNPWVCGVGKTFCIPQKGTKTKLDALNIPLMFRLQYRRLGANDERLVVNHTVRASKGQAGLRWYELMDTGAGWAIVNQGTYTPDGSRSRFMGSVAMDADGNIAAGYSLSSGKMYPSIGIAGRTATGPANTFDLAERKVFTGPGSLDGRFGRWGDYSDMTVAEDGCTFYYTQQYYKKTGQWRWATRIVRFQIDPGACA